MTFDQRCTNLSDNSIVFQPNHDTPFGLYIFTKYLYETEFDYEDILFHHDSATGKIIEPKYNHPAITPAFINKRLAELLMSGISCVFTKNHDYTATMVYELLRVRASKIKA